MKIMSNGILLTVINELSLETDQTGCFDESGKALDCQDTGQDGAVKKVRRMEAPDRFRIMNDIVQDKWTGLVWHTNADLPGFPVKFWSIQLVSA